MTARIINQRNGTEVAAFPTYELAADHRLELRREIDPTQPCPYAIRTDSEVRCEMPKQEELFPVAAAVGEKALVPVEGWPDFRDDRLECDTEIVRTAVISDCGRWRYELIRRWDGGPLLEFIMLNPSTADGRVDDATIRRCVNFAKRWGYGGIVVRNLFAYRATNPDTLVNLDQDVMVGPENREYLSRDDADCTIVAWGAHPAAVSWWDGYPFAWQRTAIRRPALFCLGTNANGSPKHPLYVPADRTPVRWEAA